MCTVLSVGQPFPGEVPKSEGTILEMLSDGSLMLFIQMPNPTLAEMMALEAGFERYSYYEATNGEVSLGMWVFKFPALGYLEAPFHVGLYDDDRARKFLENDWNALSTVVLDGQVIRMLRSSGLQMDAVNLFKDSIRRQGTEKISRASYDAALDQIRRMSPKEIFRRGQVFRHGESYRRGQGGEELEVNPPIEIKNAQAAIIVALGFDPVALGGKVIDGELYGPDANPNERGPCSRCGKGGVWIAGAGEILCARHQDDY
jgi:hypothetical protein